MQVTTKHHILTTLLLALTAVAALVSCAGEEELDNGAKKHPIAFASVAAEQETMTRATTTLGHDFVVYGYKSVGGTEQVVFDGYNIKYREGSANSSEDNTDNYYYVGDNQTIKYWDYGASEYHFWGVWKGPGATATFSGEKHNVLTFPGVKLRVGDPVADDDVLYSALYVRCPISREVVELSFKRPYAKVRVQFYTTDDVHDNVTISNISFAPDPASATKIYGQGDVKVTYPSSTDDCRSVAHESVEVVNLGDAQDAFLYDAVTLTPTEGVSSNTAVTAPVRNSEPAQYYYYPLPMGDQNPAFVLSANVNGDADVRTAVVPAALMQWKPNYSYTYIFKINNIDASVELYDVQIDPWLYGGSQDEEWKNW